MSASEDGDPHTGIAVAEPVDEDKLLDEDPATKKEGNVATRLLEWAGTLVYILVGVGFFLAAVIIALGVSMKLIGNLLDVGATSRRRRHSHPNDSNSHHEGARAPTRR